MLIFICYRSSGLSGSTHKNKQGSLGNLKSSVSGIQKPEHKFKRIMVRNREESHKKDVLNVSVP